MIGRKSAYKRAYKEANSDGLRRPKGKPQLSTGNKCSRTRMSKKKAPIKDLLILVSPVVMSLVVLLVVLMVNM